MGTVASSPYHNSTIVSTAVDNLDQFLPTSLPTFQGQLWECVEVDDALLAGVPKSEMFVFGVELCVHIVFVGLGGLSRVGGLKSPYIVKIPASSFQTQCTLC